VIHRRRSDESLEAPHVSGRAAATLAALVTARVVRPKPRRTRTPPCLTVDRRFRYADYSAGETIPLLRMAGRWVDERGFSIGGNSTSSGEGRLILTNDDARFAELMESHGCRGAAALRE
jgi:hypothetical protein